MIKVLFIKKVNIIKSVYKVLILSVALSVINACSSEDSSDSNSSKEHVWKGQTDQIDKANEVESMMLDAKKQSETALEQQIQ